MNLIDYQIWETRSRSRNSHRAPIFSRTFQVSCRSCATTTKQTKRCSKSEAKEQTAAEAGTEAKTKAT
ncbi:hypothetical protein [Paenibacillus agaridevorans]|uniref:hypothetical protein n=1 Tax=Paenibacillus agaridevorans TaxID=171404 RepID=UPI0015E803F8|nr:hypothetical protein [Paenibacillus agaridevorans]